MRNLHIEHIEDLLFTGGYSGAKKAVDYLKLLESILTSGNSGNLISTKFDGSPAIVFGIHPENKKFFIGTKSVFALDSKICYEESDIDLYYETKPQLSKILKVCLKNLRTLKLSGIFQADFLYSKELLKNVMMGGEIYVTFCPNTITYKIPLKTTQANEILNSQIGIVVHTEYSGNTIKSLSSTPITNYSKLPKVKNVYIFFPIINKIQKFTSLEKKQYLTKVNTIETGIRQSMVFLNKLANTGSSGFLLSTLMKKFMNSYVRTGKKIPIASEVIQHFYDYLVNLFDQEILKKKTDISKSKYIEMKKSTLALISSNRVSLLKVISCYLSIQYCKQMALTKLNSSQSVLGMLKTDSGYVSTSPEGFVLYNQKSNSTVKLIDRFEFSVANFNNHSK